MEVLTTQPGVQLYTSNFLDGKDVGKVDNPTANVNLKLQQQQGIRLTIGNNPNNHCGVLQTIRMIPISIPTTLN